MNFATYLALLGWPLVALTLCAMLPPRRAVITAFIVAWLFLPMAKLPIPGLPDWTKISATCVSLLAGLLIFDLGRLTSFRPRWIDLPMAAWCLCPFATSLTNDLGLYDGLSASLGMAVTWGLPYLFGRLYLNDVDGLREMAVGLFLGGLVYIPFCLFEFWMSPQLHHIVYGYHQHSLAMSWRFGGWRPSVFMDHGLMVAMWMSMSSLVGIWLWVSGTLRSLRGIALTWFLVPLLVTAVLCKSAGALALLVVGSLVFLLTRRLQSPKPLFFLGAVAPLYILLRLTGLWSGAGLVELVKVASEDRGASVETRFHHENLLSARALQRPVFGWGGWGRSRIRDESGTDTSVTDGLWIIELGVRGFVGLTAMLSVFLLPLAALVRVVPAREWTRARAAPAAALAAVVMLYLIDCLPNAMISPIYMLAAGGISALAGFEAEVPERLQEQESTPLRPADAGPT